MENRGERSAGVLDIHVDVAAGQGAVADERTAKIETALYGQPGLTLDRLRQDLAEHELLGEILRTHDHGARRPSRCGTGREEHDGEKCGGGGRRRGGRNASTASGHEPLR